MCVCVCVYVDTICAHKGLCRRARLIREDPAFPAKRCAQLTAVVHRPEAQVGSVNPFRNKRDRFKQFTSPATFSVTITMHFVLR